MSQLVAINPFHFTASDVFGIYLLSQTSAFHDLKVVRTLDSAEIDKCGAVLGIGKIYDESKNRFDYHFLNSDLHFQDTQIPISTAGLVYMKFGKEINKNILSKNGRDVQKLDEFEEQLFKHCYNHSIREIDAYENHFPLYPEEKNQLKYDIHIEFHNKIMMMNYIGSLEEALKMVSEFYEHNVLWFYDVEIPSLVITKKCYNSRFEVDPSGQIIVMDSHAHCKFKDFEKEDMEKNPDMKEILYIVFPRVAGNWGIRAINTVGFQLRKPLPFAGLRDDELSKESGIEGGVFVHKTGFTGAFKEKENAIKFAKYAVSH